MHRSLRRQGILIMRKTHAKEKHAQVPQQCCWKTERVFPLTSDQAEVAAAAATLTAAAAAAEAATVSGCNMVTIFKH